MSPKLLSMIFLRILIGFSAGVTVLPAVVFGSALYGYVFFGSWGGFTSESIHDAFRAGYTITASDVESLSELLDTLHELAFSGVKLGLALAAAGLLTAISSHRKSLRSKA